MKLVKPGWFEHRVENRRFEIYSIAASADGKRLATGGLDTKVRVWSAKALLKDEPHLLCSMSTHTGAVTCVGFSPNGRYLASGSDDRICLIWELDLSRVPRAEFGSAERDREVWTARKRLIGHDNDIQGLAWSPDSSLLVTVGLDSAIIVWSGTTFEQLKRIDSHQSHVKGIAFDPANKYFITCSDDRTARVVRYSRSSPVELTFSIEVVIDGPFQNSPLSTYFRRCSWSPDGETIACPNATNGPVPSVAIVNRGEWDAEMSLIGHEGAVEVCAFSPRVYVTDKAELQNLDSKNSQTTSIVATGGQDMCVAIWSSSSARPLLIVRNVCSKPISDLAWSPDGLSLYVASLDGSVLVIQFEATDLGWPLEPEMLLRQLQRYGGTLNDIDIPESTEQLDVEKRLLHEQEVAQAETNDKSISREGQVTPTRGESLPCLNKPTAQSPLELNRALQQNPRTPKQQISPVSARKSDKANVRVPANSTTLIPTTPVSDRQHVEATRPSPIKQRVTITKDGRKRVAPTLITDEQPTIAALPAAELANGGPRKLKSSVTLTPPSNALPRGGISSLVIGAKRRATDEAPKRKNEPGFTKPAVFNPALLTSQVRLATPRVSTHVSTDKESSAVFEARNGEGTNPARVFVVQNGQIVFVDYVPDDIHLITGQAEFFWAAATDTGTLYVWMPEGARALPPIVVGSPLVLLQQTEHYLAAVTSTGMVFGWNIHDACALFTPTSLAPVLDVASRYGDDGLLKAPSVTDAQLINGRILVSLSNGTSYTYDNSMLAWCRVSEPFLAYGSQYWDSTGFASLFEGGGPVAMAERRTTDEALLRAGARGKQLQRMARNRMLQEGYQGFEDAVSIAHLETRICSAGLLNSKIELNKYLDMYVQRLAQDGNKRRLGEFLRTLSMNPPRVLGHQSRETLKRLLAIAAKYRAVQSVVIEFSDI